MMKNNISKFFIVSFITATIFLSGCDLIAGVFKAGFLTAIILVVIIVGLIIFGIKKLL